MKVTFWGTRGSIAAPGASTVRYGGNTSCVGLVTDRGTLVVLDAGTGVRLLGDRLLALMPTGIHGHMLLTHTHWDHIQGFPFFAPVFVRGNDWSIYAPLDGSRRLKETLSGQMQYTYFPVELQQISAGLDCKDLEEGEFTLHDLHVRAQYLNHPAVTLGYRLTAGRASVVYCTDHEPFSPVLFRDGAERSLSGIVHAGDRRHAEFVSGADLLIHDAQYTAEEYESKRNWGHSTVDYVVDIAVAARVKRVALYHHDPSHSDQHLDEIQGYAQTLVAHRGATIEVFCAREGETVVVAEQSPVQAAVWEQGAADRSRPHILVADDEPIIRELVRDILESEHYTVDLVGSGEEALSKIAEELPDLVLLDMRLPGINGLQVLESVRGSEQGRELPVIMVTALSDSEDIDHGFRLGATDYMTKPFSPAQLRARVSGWLRRSSHETRAEGT